MLQRRATNPVDLWWCGRYLRVLRSGSDLALVELSNRGTLDAPDVRFSVRAGAPRLADGRALAPTLRRVLGLDVDPEPLRRQAEAERALRPVARALRGMRPPRFPDFFEAFASVVPFQQLSLDAGLAIVGRLVERLGGALEHGGRRFRAFPTAEAVAEARVAALHDCGLSRRKAESLRGVAREIASGALREDELSGLESGDALRRLRALPGIGPWSASLVLLRGLGRLDVFPPGDVGAERRLGALLGVRTPAALERVVRRFGDRPGYLYFCGLGGSLLAGGSIRAAPAVTR